MIALGIPPFALFGAAAIILLSLTAVNALYYRYFHALAQFPGPFLASCTNAWKAYQVAGGKFEHTLLDLHRRYGPIVRIGPDHLDVSDAASVKEVYGAGRAFKKSQYYDAFRALRANLFGVRDEEIHSARRKALANGFSLQSVAQMEGFIDGCLRQLIQRLDRAAATGEVINLKKWISFYVMDVLGELAFSRSFHVLETGDESKMPPVREHVLLATMSGQLPWLIPYINKVVPYIPIPSLQRMISGRDGLRKMAVTSVNARLSSDSLRKDLLGRLLSELSAGVDSKGRTLDIIDVQTEAFGFIVAGSHTTAATSTLLFWHLLHNPSALSRLQSELDSIPPPESSTCYPFAPLANLPYLQACVTENYRISPVFVMPLMRVVPGDRPTTIAGQLIPPGTDVSITNHALHHDPAVFGPNLERFQPERWLDPAYARDRAGLLMPFGAGHRACIGRNIATAEIFKLVASLLARYRVEYVGGEAEGLEGMPETRSFGVADLHGEVLVRLGFRKGGA